MEFLQFVFRDFWTFVGFWILLAVVFKGVEAIVDSLRGKR